MKDDGSNQTMYEAGRYVKPRPDLQAAARTFSMILPTTNKRDYCSFALSRVTGVSYLAYFKILLKPFIRQH